MSQTLVDPAVHDRVMAAAEEIQSWGEAAERLARDPVNQPTINTWLEAMDFPAASQERFRAGETLPWQIPEREQLGALPPRWVQRVELFTSRREVL